MLQERWVFWGFGVQGLMLECGLCMTGNVLWCVRLYHKEQFQSMEHDFYWMSLWSSSGLPKALLGSFLFSSLFCFG